MGCDIYGNDSVRIHVYCQRFKLPDVISAGLLLRRRYQSFSYAR